MSSNQIVEKAGRMGPPDVISQKGKKVSQSVLLHHTPRILYMEATRGGYTRRTRGGHVEDTWRTRGGHMEDSYLHMEAAIYF